MAVSATRVTTITYSGDVQGSNTLNAAANAVSPGSVTVHGLTTNTNTIAVPSSPGVTVKGATIVPPAGNAQTLTLKSTTADTGMAISNTDPTTIAFETAPAQFFINAGGVVSGLRIFWT